MASIIRSSIVIFMIFFVILYVTPIEESMEQSKLEYAVIIDAGSTGSRVSTFCFKKTPNGGLKLLKEYFDDTRPGLSGFANNPEEGAKSIDGLVKKALGHVPKKYWESTPLALKATSGLRLLPNNQSEDLQNKIREFFVNYPFYTNYNSVVIMKDIDEGLYSWFTVNYLFGYLDGQLNNTVAALDLGGGSIQITLIPTDSEKINPDFIKDFSVMNKKVNFYTQSYLGLGLMAAREKILTADGNSLNVISPCVQKAVKNSLFKFGQSTYYVTGAKSKNGPAIDYQQCKTIIENVVNSTTIDKPEDLFKQQIVAFSYFYFRSEDAGIVDENGGNITIESFYIAAEKECSKTHYNESDPFKCLDLTYFAVLLHEGFGLSMNTSVTLLKSINNKLISWALGAAYYIIENGIVP